MSDLSEVERLRARIAELEAQRSSRTGAGGGERSVWRGVASAVLIVAACVLAPVSVASVWAGTHLSDTDSYVETVAPLADDPAVQDALAQAVTAAVFEELDVEALATQAFETFLGQTEVPPLVADALPNLAVPLADGVESFTRDQVDAFLATPEFAQVWAEVNRVAHEQVVALLEGNAGGAVSAQDNQITLNLAPIVAAVRDRLVDQGFGLAANVPEVERTFVLAESDAITDAQGAYRLVNALGVWMPVVVLALLVTGVLLARDRRLALLRGALGVAAGAVLLGVLLALARLWYVETTPGDVLSAEAAGGVFDALVRFLKSSIRGLAVAALVVAFVAFLAGPSTPAVRTRATFQRSIGSARDGAEVAGWDTGPLGTWVFAHRRALQIATLATGGLVLVFWDQPTAWVVAGAALAVVLALAVVEFLGAPPPAPVSSAAGPVPALPRQVPRTPEEQTDAAGAPTVTGADRGATP